MFRPGWVMLGLQASFSPSAAASFEAVYEFRVGGETFHTHITDGQIHTLRLGPASDAVIEAGEETFLDLALGRLALTDAVRAGDAQARGDKAALAKLRSLFPTRDRAAARQAR